jgi:hypothetical protein
MPRTVDPAKQPQAFYLLLDRLRDSETKEVFIATPHPSSLRGQIQAFLLSLTKSGHPRAAEAEALMVRFTPKDDPRGRGILVCDRDRSPAALAVLGALGQTGPGAAEAESSFLEKLGS